MKVLVITPGVLPVPATKGGAVEKLIEEYIDYNENNYKVDFTVYTIKDDKENYNLYKHTQFRVIDGNKVTYKIEKVFRWIINNIIPKIHIGNVFINKVIKDLKKRKEKYDLIIVENISYNVLFLRKLFPDTKIIYHIHNDFLNAKTKKAKKILEQSNLIISVSNYIKNRIQEIEPTDKICVVYNGIDIDRFSKKITENEKDMIRNKYGLNKQDIVFVFVGRFVKEKGVKELVTAFTKILQEDKTKYSNVKLLVVGSKSGKNRKKDRYRLEVENIASKCKDNIKFIGFIPYDELPKIYNISDIQIVPSRWGEAFGNVVIEGMASGIHQIVTNDGGIPEIVNGRNVKIIEKDNLTENLYKSIKDTLEDKEKFFKRNEFTDIEKYSKKEYCKNIFELINKENA